jgi:uncharacterized protein involved in outer membrane biogenesis
MRWLFRPSRLAILALGSVLCYTLVGFFLLPYLITTFGIPKVAETIRHPVVVKEVAVNPFELSLRITGLEIREPDQTPMIGFEEFFVNFQAVSLFRLAYVFDAIRLTMPYVAVKVAPNGHLNLLDLVPVEAPAEPVPPFKASDQPGAIPAVQIGVFELVQGIVEFRDESKPNPVSIDIVPIGIVLRNFHTKPGGENTYAFTAELDKGEVLDWKGTITLEPVRSEGTLVLRGIKIPALFRHVQGQFNFDLPTGSLTAQAHYRFDTATTTPDFHVTDAFLHLADIRVVEKGALDPVISVPSVKIDGVQVDLRQHKVAIASIAVADASDRAWLNPDKTLNFQTLFAPVESGSTAETPTPASAPTSPAGDSSPWSVAVKQVEIRNHTIQFEDRSLPFPMRAKVVVKSARSHDLAWPIRGPIPLSLEQTINDTGTFALDGQMALLPFQADFTLVMKNIGLAPFEPYLEQATRIGIDGGALDMDGTFHLAVEHPKAPLMTFRGNVGVKSLALVNREDGLPFVGWKHLLLRQIALTVDPTTVALEEVGLDQPRVQLVVQSDGTVNLSHLVKTSIEAEAKPAQAVGAPSGKPVPAPEITIKTVKLMKGAVIFQDDSITPTVRAGLEGLTGTVKGLSSKQVARADVDMSGKLDRVAPLRIVGKINPLTEDAFTDLTVKFDNIDLTTAGPYSGKYVGYPIRKGKLFLDLAYKVSQKELAAENRVLIDQLGFGDKNNSPDAISLPVPLVVALLKDRKGQIAIDLPIRGNLKDPDFKYGKVVVSTLLNILTKLVTSPFTLMGKLIPGGAAAEDLQYIEFDPGAALPVEAELKKVEAVRKGLEERPALCLEITGTADPIRDRKVLGLQKFKAQLLAKWQQGNRASTVAELPMLEEERLIKELFDQQRSQQPATSPASATEPAPKPPTIDEMRQQLAAAIPVPDSALRALAQQRADQVRSRFSGEGKLADERLFLTEVDVAAADHDRVRSRLNITAGQ